MFQIQTILKPGYKDTKALQLQKKIKAQLGIDTGKIKTSKLYVIDYPIRQNELKAYAEQCLQNPITEQVFINRFYDEATYRSMIAVAQLPGVTDDVGMSAQMALADYLNRDNRPECATYLYAGYLLF